MTLDEWVDLVCRELDIDRPDIQALLDFTREVAHQVARPAAPLTSLLVGLAARNAENVPAVIDRVRALLPPATGEKLDPTR